MSNEEPSPPGRRMGLLGVVAFGVYFAGLSTLIFYVLLAIWPAESTGAGSTSPMVLFRRFPIDLSSEVRLLWIVVLAGALGSYVHAATSFITFVGNRDLKTSWAWWYLLRPFIGASLAIIVYFSIRGGLVSTGADVTDVSYFGIAAISGLVGMFSKEAVDKLHELFKTAFRTGEEVPRKD